MEAATNDQLLRGLAENLRTQDNAITENPIFLVQQRRRIWGYNSDDYSQEDCVVGIAWFNEDDDEADDKQVKSLRRYWSMHHETPEGWRRVGFIDIWEFVQPFFTRAAAELYIEQNHHNLRDPRVYVASGYRNEEWKFLRGFIQALGASL